MKKKGKKNVSKKNITVTNTSDAKPSKEKIINQAFKFHSQGNISEAAKYYQYCINNNFNDHRVFSNFGVLLKSLGKLQEAEVLTRKAIELNPNFTDAHSNLGSILKDLGKLKEAEKSTRKAVELNPNFAMANYNLGTILKDLGKLKEAEVLIRKAIELNPNFADAHSNLGLILKDLGKLQEAEVSHRKAIEIKPDFANANTNLGNLLIDIGKLKEAEVSTRKAIELNPNFANAHSNLGVILKDLGKLKEAEKSTRKAIEIKPDFALAYSTLGTILKDLGKLEEAEILQRKAIKLKPDFAQSHLKLGEILFKLGKLEESRFYEWNAIKILTSSIYLKSYKENAKVIKKTAFFVFSYTVFNHFRPIIEINPKLFEILIQDNLDDKIKDKIHKDLNNQDIRIRSVSEIIKGKLIYEKLVSIRGDEEGEFIDNENDINVEIKKVPTIKLLGKKNIRFMYTAGKDKYTIYSYWNKYYDGILCYGPYHEDKFKVKHKIATSQMGYPRFDKYFNPGFEKDELLHKFNCDPKKKTIVWLTTWNDLSSISKYLKGISSLNSEHNIIIRPHPQIKKDDPENYNKLFTIDVNYIDDNEDDNVQLFAIADLLLVDYGGSMFGSLYLNKNFAFLDMNLESKNNNSLGDLSSEDYLRSFFPDRIVKLENIKNICNYCLKNPPSNSVMKTLREEFFNTNYQGNSAKRAFDLLNSNKWLS